MESDEETAFMGLTDIISNLMVLFILLTVFVLTIKLNEASQENAAFGENGLTGGLFPTVLNSELSGLVTTIVVRENGFGRLNWQAISDHVAAQSSVVDLEFMTAPLFVPQREGAVAPERMEPYVTGGSTGTRVSNVIDAYLIKLELDKKIPDWALIEAESDDITARLLAEAGPKTDLSFIVYPDGMPQFVPVYESLIEQGACFRWTPWDANTKYIITSVSYEGQNRCPK